MKWQGSVGDLVQLMNTLKGVKESINLELSELQGLLDNTSKYLSNINEEYIKIKQRILDYTSQVLDASFTRYKDNMVSWSKYEDVQKKSIILLDELDKSIRDDDIIVN